MADVDRWAFAKLEGRKLRMRPHAIITASGSRVTAFMADIGAVTQMIYEDASISHLLQLEGRIEPAGASARSDDREFSSIFSAEWYRKRVQHLSTDRTSIAAYSFFWDPTVHKGSGAKYCALVLFLNNLPLSVRYLSENVIVRRLRSRESHPSSPILASLLNLASRCVRAHR